MFITYIGLHKFKRFAVGRIETMEVWPKRKVQLLLGTNGSGKSSFLEVATSVMPKDKNDFHKGGGGWWKMEFLHNGKTYFLSTHVLENKTEHSFVVDGEELNQGKTVGVQKGLVKEHFRMTQELHDVLTGAKPFTGMSANERQYWMTTLSDSDFSYVLGLYDRLKKAHRANLNVLKHTQDRIVEEMASLIKPEDIEQMQARSKELHGELSVLYREYSGHDSQSLQRMEQALNEESTRIAAQLTRLVLVDLKGNTSVHYDSLEAIDEELTEKRNKANQLTGTLQTLSEHYEHYDRQLEKLREAEGLDVADLRDQQKALQLDRQKSIESLSLHFKVGTLDCGQAAKHAGYELITLFSQVQNINLEEYDPEEMALLGKSILELQERLSGVNGKLGILEGRLQYIHQCEEVACPKCSTQFKPGVGLQEQEELKQNFAKGDGLRVQMQNRLIELRERHEKLGLMADAASRLQRFREAHGELAPLFSLIDQAGGLNRTNEHAELCGVYLRELGKHSHILSIDEQLGPIEDALAKVTENAESGAGIREAHARTQAQIEEVHGKIQALNGLIREISSHLEKIKRFDLAVDNFEEEYKSHQGKVEQYVEMIRQEELGGLIETNQSSLAVVSEALKSHEVQAGIIDDLEKSARKLKLRDVAYSKLLSELSPTDGFIAEQIGLYINSVLEANNQIIASVWDYPMGIKPCDVEEGELNYKFPLWVNDLDNNVPDIAKGSTGQRSMINLAFRLSIYHFLGLEDWPLYMDEIGRDFDPKHRHNLVRITEELVDDPRYSQVFIVSHHIETYGSIVEADVTALDDSNIPSDRPYNENAVIV